MKNEDFQNAISATKNLIEKSIVKNGDRDDFIKRYNSEMKTDEGKKLLEKSLKEREDIHLELERLKTLLLEAENAGDEKFVEKYENEISEVLEKFSENIKNLIPEKLSSDFQQLLDEHTNDEEGKLAGLLKEAWDKDEAEVSEKAEIKNDSSNPLAEQNNDDNEKPPLAEMKEEVAEEDEVEKEKKKDKHNIKTTFEKSHYEFTAIGGGGNQYLDVVSRLVIDPVLDFGLNLGFKGWDGIMNACENFRSWDKQKTANDKYVAWMEKEGYMVDEPSDEGYGNEELRDQQARELSNIKKSRNILGQNRALNASSKLTDFSNNPFGSMDAMEKHWKGEKEEFKKKINSPGNFKDKDVFAKNEKGEEICQYETWNAYEAERNPQTGVAKVFDYNTINIPAGMIPGMPIPKGWKDDPKNFDPDRDLIEITPARELLNKRDEPFYKIDSTTKKPIEKPGTKIKIGTERVYEEKKIKSIEKEFRKNAVEFFEIFEQIDLMDLKGQNKEKELEKVKNFLMEVVGFGNKRFEDQKNKVKSLESKEGENIIRQLKIAERIAGRAA